MEDKTQKEKIREKFRKDYYQTGKLTYIEEDGTERADSGKIIDWWLNELDLAIKETEERMVEKVEHIPNPFHSVNMDRLGMEKAGEFESNRDYILALIRNK